MKNSKKILAGIMAVCFMGSVTAIPENIVPVVSVTTSAETAEYTEGTYEQLTYKNYGDYIEISGCDESATEVVIPAEIDGLPVTSIGEQAFPGCSKLTSVTIPDSITSIGEYAFSSCVKLTSVTIPDSVKSIGNAAFYGCTNLSSVTLPKLLTDIDGLSFFGTPWLNTKQAENPLVIINDTLLLNGQACSGDVVIPDNIKTIASNAFYQCKNLTSVTIPDSVTNINTWAFQECASLESVTIPQSVKNIGKEAFDTRYKLKSVTILNPDCNIYDDGSTFSDFVGFNGTIYGYDNSTAQTYAEKYDRKFESLGEAPKKETATGDANDDGKINMSDAVLIMQSISNPSEYTLTEAGKKSADVVDGDGITNKDALAIQMIEAKLLNVEDFPITSADMEKLM